MKKKIPIILSICIAILVSQIGLIFSPSNTVYAATRSDLNSIDFYMKQPWNTDYCTLYANMMMLRRNAYIHNDSTWTSIDWNTCSYLWGGNGLVYPYVHTTPGGTSAPVNQYANDPNWETGTDGSFRWADGSTKRWMIQNLLTHHPEGVVVFDWDRPHAILVTDYTDGMFYVSDPDPGVQGGRISEYSTSLRVENCESYYIVTEPGTITENPPVFQGSPKADVGADFYAAIQNRTSGTVLQNTGVDHDPSYAARMVQGYALTGTTNQIWHFIRQGDGSYKIVSASDGYVLEVRSGQESQYNIVAAYSVDNGTPAQRWNLYLDAEVGYYFQSACCSNMCLDLAYASTENGGTIQINVFNTGGGECFNIVRYYHVVFKDGSDIVQESYVPYGSSVTPPNITRDGYALTWYGGYYQRVTSDMTINANWEATTPVHEHTIVTDPAVAATCTSTGLTEGSHCSECGEIIVEQSVVPMIDHTIVVDPAVEPTATETGLTEGSHCSVCGAVIVAQEIIPATGNPDPVEPVEGNWNVVDGISYYVLSDGSNYRGWLTLSDKTYYLDPDTGAMRTGWQDIDGSRYYFKTNGTMIRGWKELSGQMYYFDPETGAMRTGWQEIEGNTYYFKSNGAMIRGWKTFGSKTYYFGEDGVMRTGWQDIDGNTYYFKTNGVMITGWKTWGSKTYYFGEDGIMRRGWQDIDGNRYYFKTSGVMIKGWKVLSGKTYYFDPTTGAMYTGLQTIDGSIYYFKTNGIMLVNTNRTVDGVYYEFGADGACTNVTPTPAPIDDPIEDPPVDPPVDPTEGSLTVSFNSMGGFEVEGIVVTTGGEYGELPIPTRDYYTFTGWYTAETEGSEITASTTVTESGAQTLYARWQLNDWGAWSDWSTTNPGEASEYMEVESNTVYTYVLTSHWYRDSDGNRYYYNYDDEGWLNYNYQEYTGDLNALSSCGYRGTIYSDVDEVPEVSLCEYTAYYYMGHLGYVTSTSENTTYRCRTRIR